MYSAMLTSHFYTHKSTSQGISHTDFLEEKSVGLLRPRRVPCELSEHSAFPGGEEFGLCFLLDC